ncbi:MAG: hypothetical protein QXF76_04065 [Candidatus Anstonellales archaeon]
MYNEPLAVVAHAIIALGWVYQYATLHKGEHDIKPYFIIAQLVGMALLSLSGYFSNNYFLSLIAAVNLIAASLVGYKVWKAIDLEKIIYHNVEKVELTNQKKNQINKEKKPTKKKK